VCLLLLLLLLLLRAEFRWQAALQMNGAHEQVLQFYEEELVMSSQPDLRGSGLLLR